MVNLYGVSMHNGSRILLALLGSSWLVPALPAQGLRLDLSGGSMPGTANLDLYPGAYPFQPCAMLFGIDSGPTPVAIVDPSDPRSVRVGQQLLGSTLLGVVGFDLHFRVGPLAVPSSPALLDSAWFTQGVTYPGTGRLVDQISNPRAIRLAYGNTFRDRLVFFQDERAFATVLPAANDQWLLAGGGRGALLAQVAHSSTEFFDPIDETFSYGPSMTVARSLHAATRLGDGRWLISGGVNQTNDPQAACEIWDPVAGTFTVCAPMLTPRTGHTATLLNDGRVFVTGGLAAMTVTPLPIYAIFDTTNSTEIYNPVTNTWTAGPNLSTPRAAHAAILRPNGTVLLAGGISWFSLIINNPTVRATCDIYNPATNTMAAGPAMATARSFTFPVPLGNDRYLMAGGIANLSWTVWGTPTTTAEIYDAVANAWSPAGNMATARGMHVAVPLGHGRFLCGGGANGDILTPVALASCEVYDAATNGWTAAPAMTIPRAAFAAHLTPTGQWMLFGGSTAQGAISRGTEWYYF